MKLDRNISRDTLGKYLVVNLHTNKLEWGFRDTEEEFFVIKLKDINAEEALKAYAIKALETDEEFSKEVMELSKRAGPNNKWCKIPD